MIIIWSPSALSDLESLRHYISIDSSVIAEKVARTIITTIDKLLTIFPESGRIGLYIGTRELVLAKFPYFVSYTCVDNRIIILRVYHTSRLW